MRKLLKIIKFLVSHPIGRQKKIKTIFRFLSWQIVSNFFVDTIIFNYIENSKLIVKKSLHSATANMYVGLQEYKEMSFLLHLLKQNDIFFDIGANVGIYTILASKIKNAKTFSFEPVKSTSYYLKNNIMLNQIEDLVTVFEMALGNSTGKIAFSTNQDSENHVIINSEENHYLVEIKKLDDVIDCVPLLVKMDVEGYEFHVLNGAQKTISNQNLKAIIIELNGVGKNYGIEDIDIHDLIISYGFRLYNYEPLDKKLIELNKFTNGNNIYIRDIEFVQERVKNAEKIKIFGSEI